MRARGTGPETIVVDATAAAGPVGLSGAAGAPVLIGVVGGESADSALRVGFAEAARRTGSVLVLGVGPATAGADPAEAAARWAEKYPEVGVTVVERRTVDAAVTLTAASRSAGLVVLQITPAPAVAAVAAALRRRAACPVVLVRDL